jgi:8-oxo-dGTP diphosphatase
VSTQIPDGLEFYDYDTRVAAYAVVVDGERLLLSWWNGEQVAEPQWTLPGGGVDLAESLEEGVVREVSEETGFDVELTGLLTTHTKVWAPERRQRATDRWMKAVRVIYAARVVSGTLGTLEVGGSTDFAEWVPIADLPDLPHTDIVDIGLRAWQERRTEA